MDRIKRLSYEILEKNKSKFGEDFSENKKVLSEISVIRSKLLKNEIAGYITKFIKKENYSQKQKESRSHATIEDKVNLDVDIEEEQSQDVLSEDSEEISSDIAIIEEEQESDVEVKSE